MTNTMIGIGIITIDALTIYLSLWFVKSITKSRSLFSINFLSLKVLIDFLSYSIIGSSVILLGFGVGYYEHSFMRNSTTQKYVWLATIYSCIFLFFTLFLLERKTRFKPIHHGYKMMSSSYEGAIRRNLAIFIIALMILSVFYYLYYCVRHGYWPFLAMFTNSAEQLSQIRYNDKFLSSENTIIKNFLLLVVPPVTSYATLFCYRKKRNRFWRNSFLVSFIIASLCLTYRFEKSYFLYYLLGFMIMPQQKRQKESSQKEERRKKRALLIIGVFGLFFVLFVTGGKDSFNLSNIYRSFYRLFLGQIVGLYRHFELFPGKIDFLKFQYFPTTIAKLFGHEEIRSARIIMMETYGAGSSSGNMVSLFVGEAYANGGVISAVLSPIVVAVAIYIQMLILSMMEDNPLTRGCIVFYALNSIPLTGGFLDFLYNPTYIILIIVCLAGSFVSTGRVKLAIKKPMNNSRIN